MLKMKPVVLLSFFLWFFGDFLAKDEPENTEDTRADPADLVEEIGVPRDFGTPPKPKPYVDRPPIPKDEI